jgi:hypothetical protein
MLGKHSTLWAIALALLCLFYFWGRVSVTLPRLAWNLRSPCHNLLSSWNYKPVTPCPASIMHFWHFWDEGWVKGYALKFLEDYFYFFLTSFTNMCIYSNATTVRLSTFRHSANMGSNLFHFIILLRIKKHILVLLLFSLRLAKISKHFLCINQDFDLFFCLSLGPMPC